MDLPAGRQEFKLLFSQEFCGIHICMADEKSITTVTREPRQLRSNGGEEGGREAPLDKDLQEMMKAGLHFGHKKSKTDPKMKPYITGVRNMVHIIDLANTKEKLEEALTFVAELVKDDKVLLLVGRKIQIQAAVEQTAKEAKIPYISGRWIGGLITNFESISKRIEELRELERKEKEGELEKYTKKERLGIADQKKSLEKKFGGMKDIEKLPDAVFICDLDGNELVAREARKKDIPIIAIVDTNIDPSNVDYPIPANDDAVSSVKYILGKLKDVILQARSTQKTTETEKQ